MYSVVKKKFFKCAMPCKRSPDFGLVSCALAVSSSPTEMGRQVGCNPHFWSLSLFKTFLLSYLHSLLTILVVYSVLQYLWADCSYYLVRIMSHNCQLSTSGGIGTRIMLHLSSVLLEQTFSSFSPLLSSDHENDNSFPLCSCYSWRFFFLEVLMTPDHSFS